MSKKYPGADEVGWCACYSEGASSFGEADRLALFLFKQCLHAGGQIWMEAKQNGRPVMLKPGRTLDVYVPQFGAPVPGMQIFTGATSSKPVSNVVWTQTDSLQRAQKWMGLVNLADSILLKVNSFSYYNIDQYLKNANNQTINLKAETEDGQPIAAMGYAYFEPYRAIWPFVGIVSDLTQRNLPDWKTHIVSVALKDGHFYGGILSITPTTGETYVMKLKKQEPAVFKALLNNL